MGRAARASLRLSEIHPAADAGRKGQYRLDHLHCELVYPAAEPAERGTDHLSGFRARRAPPISQTLRSSCLDVSRGTGWRRMSVCRATITGDEASPTTSSAFPN